MQLIIDTREQAPLEFDEVAGVDIVREALAVGDYGCIHKTGERDKAVFERKSIGDLFSSFTHKYDNEKEKIRKAKELGIEYIITIEAPCLEIRKGHSYQKDGKIVECGKPGIAQVRQMMSIARRQGIQVWYCQGRREMAFMIMEYFLAWERIK